MILRSRYNSAKFCTHSTQEGVGFCLSSVRRTQSGIVDGLPTHRSGHGRIQESRDLYPQVHHVHTTRPDLSPSGSHLFAQLGVVLFKVDGTGCEQNDHRVHRTRYDPKEHARNHKANKCSDAADFKNTESVDHRRNEQDESFDKQTYVSHAKALFKSNLHERRDKRLLACCQCKALESL